MIERHAWAAYLAVAVAAEVALPFNPMVTALIDSAPRRGVEPLWLGATVTAGHRAAGHPAPSCRRPRAVAQRAEHHDAGPGAVADLLAGARGRSAALRGDLTARLTDIDVREIGIGVVPRDAWSGLLIAASIPVGIVLGWLQPSFLSIDRDAAFAVGLAAATLVAGSAIAEELGFRGILQPLMGRAIGPLEILLTAVVYGATYLGSQSLAVAGIMALVGLAYGVVVARSGSLWGRCSATARSSWRRSSWPHRPADRMTVEREQVADTPRLPVTAVICVRNREGSITECIASVAASRPARNLVVDGNSTDATAALARAAGADVVSDDGAGLGAARRLGAELAETPWIAYVDSDARVTPSTLSALLEVAEADGFDAVGEAPQHHVRLDVLAARRDLAEADAGHPGPAALIGCAATLVRRSLLLSVPFEATFGGAAEDHDWCFRATAAGAALAHADRAIAYHEDRASFAEFVAQRFWYGRGMARLLMRHRRLTPQARTASAGAMRTPRYVPFMLTSWAVTALGMAVETVALALNPGVRRRLREGAPSGRPSTPG